MHPLWFDDLIVFPLNGTAPNPAGTGTVEVRLRGTCSTDFNNGFFTPEGERIPRDTKPSDWHHPGLGNSPGTGLRWLTKRLRRGA